MKKVMKLCLPLVVFVLILSSVLIFYSATLSRDNNLNITEVNLCADATISGSASSKNAFDKSALSAWSVSKGGDEVVITFPQKQDVNALVINENGFNVKKYAIYYQNGEDWELCYRSYEIGINRVASFYTVNTAKLKVVVEECKNVVHITDIKAYNLEKRTSKNDFRVTSYITPPSLVSYDEDTKIATSKFDPETGMAGTVDARCFQTVTDVQLIAYGRFNGDGTVALDGYSELSLQVLREMIAWCQTEYNTTHHVNILLTIFPPFEKEGASMANMLRTSMDNSVKCATDVINETGADGIDFDWEYPRSAEEYRLYSEFIVKLKAELNKTGKLLSLAMSAWGINFSKEAIEAIDQVQIMAYDLFDHNGNNCSYAGAAESNIQYLLDKGFKLEQLNLGIAYYGRPSNGAGQWFNYNDPSFKQDEYIMYDRGVWFNTPTEVRDRTVYSILRGLGGVMTFAQDEDLPYEDELSLTASIGKAKDAFFSKEVA